MSGQFLPETRQPSHQSRTLTNRWQAFHYCAGKKWRWN